jgi:fluoride ion exporter CrcB/FEX
MTLRPSLLLLVFVGGAVGTFFRALTLVSLGEAFGVFIVNMLGTAFLAWFNGIQTIPNTKFTTERAQALLGAGFAGGFTTMSGLSLWTIASGLEAFGPFALWFNAAFNLVVGVLVYIWVYKASNRWAHHKVAELKIVERERE